MVEFRVVLSVHALVAEDAADLINLVKAADNQTFQVQLQRDAQVHVHVQGVVVGDERPCSGAACDVVQDRGLHLQVALGVEEASQLAMIWERLTKTSRTSGLTIRST